MNRQQILSRLARRHTVLYTTGLRSARDRESPPDRAAAFGRFERRDGVLVDRPPGLLRRTRSVPPLDRAIVRLAVRRWSRRLAQEGPAGLIAYAFHPKFWPFIEALNPARLVYHAYDLVPPGTEQHAGRAHLTALLRSADLVLASSDVVRAELLTAGARAVTVLANAVDYDAFSRVPEGPDPADLAPIPHPRIGYTGRLTRKVDFPLIVDLAGRRPDWQFVLIGQEAMLDDVTRHALQRARSMSNIHLLGHKSVADLPAYVARMDVNLMCYRLERELWTEGIFPLKLFEYLASGQPVVSADVPSVRAYAGVVAIARRGEDWEPLIARALRSGEPGTHAARRELARENTWDHRVARLEELLAGLV
jgi:glycosyltransferase involved in cell wall biosynthesis